MQMLVPPTRQILLVLLFLPLKALKHWNLLGKSRSNKTQQIMPQNKKKRNHRNTNNAKCVESFIWFWRDFVFCSSLYIFFPVYRTWQRTKGFCCHMWRVQTRTVNNMYVFVLWLCVHVCVISACGKSENVFIQVLDGCECKAGIRLCPSVSLSLSSRLSICWI